MRNTLKDLLKTTVKRTLGRGVRASYAQHGEDALLQTMLKAIKKGVYVDVGTFHAVQYSNTFAFYRRGWRGIVIDPNSDFKALYRLIRPRDRFVHAAVGEPGERTYYQFDDASYNTFDEARARGWEKSRGLAIKKTVRVPFKPLGEILRDEGVSRVDLMSIDVEGLDLEVLKTHDWSIPTRVIAVEDGLFDPDAPHESAIYTFLRSKDYTLKGLLGDTLVFSRPKESL